MNRRELLLYGLAVTAGAGVTSLFYQNREQQMMNPAADLERQLIQMVRPENAALPGMFPQYPTYDATVSELTSRGLVYKGNLNMSFMNNVSESDPIIEFNGWQHLETELLVLLAAHQLAGDQLVVTQTQGQHKISFNNFDVFDGIDSSGEAIATYRIDTASDYAALTACIELCDKEEGCRNITLAKNDHPVIGKKNMCWLTGDNVQRNSSPYYYSATKKP